MNYELHKAEELTFSEKLSLGLTKRAVDRISRSAPIGLANRAYRSFRYRLGLTLSGLEL